MMQRWWKSQNPALSDITKEVIENKNVQASFNNTTLQF